MEESVEERMNCNLRLHEFSLSLNELRRSSHELQAVGLHCGIIPKCTPRVQFMDKKQRSLGTLFFIFHTFRIFTVPQSTSE